MDAGSSVAASYLANPAGRNVHGHGPTHTNTDPSAAMMNQFAGLSMGQLNMPGNSAPVPMGPGHTFMVGSDGQFLLAPMHGSQPIGMAHGNENHYHNFGMAATNGYGNPYVGLQMPMMPYTPGRTVAQPRVERGQSDVPGLENRRGSYSTTESTPATPFYGAIAQRDGGPRVASLDRSAYTTPSPQQIGVTSLHSETAKTNSNVASDVNVDDLLKVDPPIPRAVPAVFTPPSQMKGVDQSLENRIPGNRNVYIRGLHPTTDDELLFKFASRFGPVETSKAIIDTATGACKGFGFAKFFHSRDSEVCIRGFHKLGYEVGFARESFNSRLKAEGDEASTNLYISNLPKTLTEVELGAIFMGFTILSSKILRDSMGNSRGVGFARFESRDICDEVIRRYNGASIREEGLLMNIRYADTPAQKELKRVTAERRQFRTNEYNIGAYGTPLVGLNPTLYNQQTQWRRAVPISRSGLSSSSSSDDHNVMKHSDTRRGISETLTIAPGAAAQNPAAATEGEYAATNQVESAAVKSEEDDNREKTDSEAGGPAEEK